MMHVIVCRNWVSTVMATFCRHSTKTMHWLTSSLVLRCLWQLHCQLNILCNHLLQVVHVAGKSNSCLMDFSAVTLFHVSSLADGLL